MSRDLTSLVTRAEDGLNRILALQEFLAIALEQIDSSLPSEKEWRRIDLLLSTYSGSQLGEI